MLVCSVTSDGLATQVPINKRREMGHDESVRSSGRMPASSIADDFLIVSDESINL